MRNIKNNPGWSRSLARNYGNGPAILFAVGTDIMIKDLRSTVNILRDMSFERKLDRLPLLTDIPGARLLKHLPTRYLDKYDLNFLTHLLAHAIYFRDEVHLGPISQTNCIAEEIILRTATALAQEYFTDHPEDFPDGFVAADILNKMWYVDIAGDDEIETFLFDDEEPIDLSPDDSYYYIFDNWFKDCYQPPEQD